MEFSDVVNLIEKLNSNREKINVGYYFSLDGNYIYCFLVKNISYDQSNYHHSQNYFSNAHALNTSPSNYAFLNTVAEEYDMRILKRIELNKKDGRVVDLISSIKELMNFCKNSLNAFSEEFCDKIMEDFLKKMTNQDILDCL